MSEETIVIDSLGESYMLKKAISDPPKIWETTRVVYRNRDVEELVKIDATGDKNVYATFPLRLPPKPKK